MNLPLTELKLINNILTFSCCPSLKSEISVYFGVFVLTKNTIVVFVAFVGYQKLVVKKSMLQSPLKIKTSEKDQQEYEFLNQKMSPV